MTIINYGVNGLINFKEQIRFRFHISRFHYLLKKLILFWLLVMARVITLWVLAVGDYGLDPYDSY